MAIKIYQSQIAPTSEVKERASTRGMRISMDTAAAPGRALAGMLEAGENVYIAYEKQKSENEVIEKAKELDKDQLTEHPASGALITQKKGLGTIVNILSESTKPDEALAEYKEKWQTELDRILPTLKGKFSKRFFKSYMNKRFIRESGSIRDKTFVNFRNESRVLKVNEVSHLAKILANNPKESRAYELAATELKSFFQSQSNYDLFGDKFKQLEFDTLNTIDELTISADLEKDPIGTLAKFKAGEYKNLNAESYTRLKAKIENHAQHEIKKEITEDTIRAGLGKASLIDANTYLKAFVGHKDYDNIKLAIDTNNYVRAAIQQVNTNQSADLKNIKLYKIEGTGAEIAAKQKANSIIEAAKNNRIKSIQDGDAAGWLNTIDDELFSLNQKINNTSNVEDKKKLIEERTILLNQKYEELGIDKSKRFVLTRSEASSYVLQTINTANPEEKDAFLNSIIDLHGQDNAPNIIRHLALEKLPIPYQTALSTNSQSLKSDILTSTTSKNLEKTVKDEGYKTKDIREKVSEGLEKYKAVIENQAPGEMDMVVYTNAIVDTVYKAALQRIVKTEDQDGSIDSAVNDFMKDYFIPNENYFIPVDVNGSAVNQQAVMLKTEAIELAVEEGSMLDLFMGDKGYKHFAELAEEDISEADAKEVVKKSIQQHSRWALSPDGDGLVLNVQLANGAMVPIVNADGQAIEFKFLNPEYVFPGTNTILNVLPEDAPILEEGGA